MCRNTTTRVLKASGYIMASVRSVICIAAICLIGFSSGNPAKPAFWKGTPLDGMVEEMRSNCAAGSDAISCMKFKVINFLDTIFKKDNFQVGDVEVRQNGFQANENDARGESGILEKVENYIQSHDVTFNVPASAAKVTISPKNLNDDELSLKVKFSDEGRSSVEGRKSKLKKIVVPLMVFVLLKAMTLIPLALGVLGLKAWNALQLSFFSFVVSLALAVFQLCKKLALDHHHPQIAAHGPWDVRSMKEDEPVPQFDAQDLVYNGYSQ